MTRTLVVVAAALSAVVVGVWWLLAVIAGFCALILIRDYGPNDPPPAVTQLRRRQLDTLCQRHEVKR